MKYFIESGQLDMRNTLIQRNCFSAMSLVHSQMPDKRYKRKDGKRCSRCWRNKLKHGSGSKEGKQWLKSQSIDVGFVVGRSKRSKGREDLYRNGTYAKEQNIRANYMRTLSKLITTSTRAEDVLETSLALESHVRHDGELKDKLPEGITPKGVRLLCQVMAEGIKIDDPLRPLSVRARHKYWKERYLRT